MNMHVSPIVSKVLVPEDPAAFDTLFPEQPLRFRHNFVGDPRLTLPALLELVKIMDRDRIEYNSGKVSVDQDPHQTPLIDLSPEEVIERIETAGAWIVLKQIQEHPVYRALLEEALLSVARAKGFDSLEAAGFTNIQGFLFVSSPGATTPFHVDPEENAFMQIHGEKIFSVYENRDGWVADNEAVENCLIKHRNTKYEERFEARAFVSHLKPGDGVFVPYLAPHWVKTLDVSYSVSCAFTWKTARSNRTNALYAVNGFLRRRGFPQPAPGAQPKRDAIKLVLFRIVTKIIAPLRKSERLRGVMRWLMHGKDGNYFYNRKM